MSYYQFFKSTKTSSCQQNYRREKDRQRIKRLLILTAIIFSFNSLWSSVLDTGEIYYQDQQRKIIFTLNTVTKEAAVGTGSTSTNQSALILPEIGSPEWDTQYWQVWSNVDIPETIIYNDETYTVTSISTNSFYKCTYIQHISLPKTIRQINAYAFGFCVNLEDFDFPADLEVISPYAFQLCKKLTKIILPSKVESIGNYAFQDCIEAKELLIPSSCASIENEAFNWCTNLERITIEDGSEPLKMGNCFDKGLSYEGSAGSCLRGMFGDASHIEEVYWGRNLILNTNSNGYVYGPFNYTSNFYSNTSGAKVSSTRRIKKLTFGDYVTEIPRNAFYNGSIEERLVLPPNLKRINDEAFYKTFMESTKTLNFPATLEYIGENALEGPNGIEFDIIESEAETPPATSFNEENKTGCPLPYYKVKNLLITIPAGARETYQNDPFWGKFALIDQNDEFVTVNVKTPGTLYGRLIAQGVQIESTQRLKLLGQLNAEDWSTIKEMKGLYELNLEEANIEEISSGMIPSTVCYIKLPHVLKKLGQDALFRLPLLGSLEIPNTCMYIGNNAVRQTLISKIILPNNGVEIMGCAFWHDVNLEEVELGNVNITGDQVFYYNNLKKVVIGNGCNITGAETFGNCDNLETIIINGNIENIGSKTFYDGSTDDSKIKNIVFNGCIHKSGENLFFSGYRNSIDPYIPIWKLEIKDLEGYLMSSFNGITSSPMNYAKEVSCNDTPLTAVSIPEGITKVSDAMFRNCSSLKFVTLPSTILCIGDAAFEGCNIEHITLPESLDSIGLVAFKACSALTELTIPRNIKVIESGAFNNCTSLMNVYSSLKEPFKLTTSNSSSNDLPFKGVNSECCLNIPIGTATKYRTANWIFPKVQEIGTLSVSVQGEGRVVYKGTEISSDTSDFMFKPYIPFELSITPDEGYKIYQVLCNGEDLTEHVIDNKLSFEDPDSDINLNVVFCEQHTIPLTISTANKWSTCILPFDATLPAEVKAYSCYEKNEATSTLVLTEVASMEAYKPYILYAEEGYDGTLSGTVDPNKYPAEGYVAEGLICGAVEPQQITSGYVLQNLSEGMKFYNCNGQTFTIPAGKCWLMPFVNGAKSYCIAFKDNTTGINTVPSGMTNDNAYYSITGQKVGKNYKGIVIINNKKHIKK
ncbi:MAG: leucine-rich repeat protein [Prevotella sp.]|nr:leucine-rich repeat protein [Prevotella sp.]